MIEVAIFILGFISAAFLSILAASDQRKYYEDKHQKEIKSWQDSMSKCNGRLLNHVCYPPYKNN